MSRISNLLKKRISAIYLIVAALLGSVASVIAVQHLGDNQPSVTTAPVAMQQQERDYKFLRLKGYKYVHPLYLAEPKDESPKFAGLKNQIDATIKKATSNHNVQMVSVYLKDFTNDEWMLLNQSEKYHPGSLFKVVTLIAYFRMSEKDPNLLSRQFVFAKKAAPAQTLSTPSLKAGNSYMVKELLYHMIVNNDNDATLLLHQHLDKAVFHQIFEDLQLPAPASIPDTGYRTNTQEYSRFVSAIYEGGYLPLPASEAAIGLLCQTTFKDGILKGVPGGTVVAHKFGEAGIPGNPELHETGIIYRNGQPYLLTIMTRGTDLQKQASLMATISGMVWEEMNRIN